jgi:hypothetical protein
VQVSQNSKISEKTLDFLQKTDKISCGVVSTQIARVLN